MIGKKMYKIDLTKEQTDIILQLIDSIQTNRKTLLEVIEPFRSSIIKQVEDQDK